MRLSIVFLGIVAVAAAQSRPQMVWEGEVDGVSVIHVRGDRVDVEDRQGAPVSRDRYRFSDRLPEIAQTVEFQIIQGRGQARILQQPSARNNFTLSVLIDDRLAGRGFYSLAFYWQTSARGGWSFEPPRRPGRVPERDEERVSWSGRVDDEAVVACSGNECRSESARGMPVTGERFTLSQALPARETRVVLDDVQGRGDVQLIDQPAPHNGFTARVHIRDPRSGTGDYSFSLFWKRLGRSEPERLFARPGLIWHGRVDGTVRVHVNDGIAQVEVVNGMPVGGERAEFMRALPRAEMPNLSVKRIRGRGRVAVVEYPSARNGWRLVFEVDDSSGGADDYQVEVGW